MRQAFALVLLFCACEGYTQHSINLGVHYGQRTNYLYREPPYKTVAGISMEFFFPAAPNTDLRVSTGAEGTNPRIGAEDNWIFTEWGIYLLFHARAGLQQYLYKDRLFLYAEPGVGVGFFPDERMGEAETKVNLSYAAGAGYRLYLGEHKYLQPSLSFNRSHYNKELRFSWISLRLAYGFRWYRKTE